jgi:P pilus assembly chaperone PapD
MNFILSSEKCYIFMSDTWNDWESTAVLFTETHQNGYMEMVYFDHETPLWYYCQSSEDTKSRVQLQVTNRESTGDGNLVYTVELINTGETYLNPEFETLQLVSSDGTIAVDLPKMIAPGASVELQLTVPEDAAVSVHLQNEYGNMCEDNILELKE